MSVDYGIKQSVSRQSIAMTSLVSLGSGAGAQSAEVDETSSLNVDEIVWVTANGSGGSNTSAVDFFVYTRSLSTGPRRTDGASGSDAAFTAANLKNARYIGSLQMNGATRVDGPGWSVANAFDGVLPAYWGLIAINKSGAALGSTSGDFTVEREPIVGTTT